MTHISVIIPVLNHREELDVLLASLSRQTLSFHDFEVVVVHNAEEPLAINPELPFQVQSLAEPNGYSYAARNRGISLSRGELLAFTDADCVAEPGWLEEAVAVVDKDSKALIAGHITVFAKSPTPSLAEKHQMTFAFDQETNVTYRRGLPTANLVVHREAFVEVGLFNPDMVSGGDTEWTKRALEHGYRAIYVPTATVRHPARETFKDIRSQRHRHAQAIDAFPTARSKFSWYARWVSPRQGVLARLRRKNGLGKRDKAKVFGLQIVLAVYQVALGAIRAFIPAKPPAVAPGASENTTTTAGSTR